MELSDPLQTMLKQVLSLNYGTQGFSACSWWQLSREDSLRGTTSSYLSQRTLRIMSEWPTLEQSQSRNGRDGKKVFAYVPHGKVVSLPTLSYLNLKTATWAGIITFVLQGEQMLRKIKDLAQGHTAASIRVKPTSDSRCPPPPACQGGCLDLNSQILILLLTTTK